MYKVVIKTFGGEKPNEVVNVPFTNWKAAVNYAQGASAVAEVMWKQFSLTRHSGVNGVITHTDTYLDMYDELTIQVLPIK